MTVAARLSRLRRSLGLRLAALFIVLALALTLIFSAGMQSALSVGWSRVGLPLVADYVDRLAAEVGTPPDPARAQALVQRLPLAIRIEGPLVQYDSQPQRRAWQRRHGPDELGDDDGWWLLTRHTADGHRIVFGLGSAAWQQRPRAIGWVTLAALLALTALAYLYVRRLFRPLDDIRAGAVRFGSGDFAQPIPQRRADELGDLAAQINTMAAEIRRMLDAKRGLLLAISHELRSPLTRARLNAELVAEGPERNALLRDLAEMRDLVTDLLESERLASGHAALQREPTDLNALIRDAVRDVVLDTVNNAGAPVDLQLAEDLPALPLDRARLRLLLRNLLDNARRHGAAATPPVLRTAMHEGEAVLSLRDFGPGVDEAQLGHLAEAFYRPDAARSRAAGGVGLGLMLCRQVALAHGGSLVFRNAQPGFEAELRLPLAG
jgi:signal transduction histidine kinase